MTELVQPIKRVEQYLYALCVLDFSNIPVPRSRLEIFTHAMITGEIPEIAPETREEEYMVAIIKGDVANLPTPKSRADHLLYRICLGETEIRDIELETRYEMLLAYLAEHGRTDLEYALINYTKAFETLYNTVEMPFKSAILKGQTLVNLVDYSHSSSPHFSKQSNGHWSMSVENNTKYEYIHTPLNQPLKDKTLYTIIADITKNSLSNKLLLVNGYTVGASVTVPLGYVGKIKLTFTTNSSDAKGWNQSLETVITTGTTGEIELGDYILLEGDYTNIDIPYFEGMKSVQMPVLTTSNFLKVLGNEEIVNIYNSMGYSNVAAELSENGKFVLTRDGLWASPNKVWRLEPNTTYTARVQGEVSFEVFFENAISNLRYGSFDEGIYVKFTTDDTGDFGFLLTFAKGVEVDFNIFYGDVTSKLTEPHKTNILSTSEDVELRGVGDVKDELDCLMGQVTKRVGEVVLDGSDDEKWLTNHKNDGENTAVFYIASLFNYSSNVIMDKFAPCLSNVDYFWSPNKNDSENHLTNNNDLAIRISKSRLSSIDVSGFRQWLSQNPVTVQYTLMTESIKTVDLNMVDQNDQPTAFKSFNDVTHVETQADSVLPTVILEYGTKNEEALAALSQDHEKVADAQAALSDAIDSQFDEVETTMMALTEVYEGGNQE